MSRPEKLPLKRKTWPDFARGVCAMLVVFSHVPGTPAAYRLLFSPFMVPLFFIVSGYLTKNYGSNLVDYLYYKLLNQVIIKYMVILCVTTFSVVKIAGLVLHPQTIPAWYLDTLSTMFFKTGAVFFSVLVVCSAYFYLINRLCRDRTLPMMLVSGGLALVGFLISRPALIRWWGWDTALICVLFYVTGYCMKKEHFLSRLKRKPLHIALLGIVYTAAVVGSALLLGTENACITVMNNTWPLLPVTLLQLLTGNLFMLTVSKEISRRWLVTRFISYVGRHSLIYFMCGGPIMAYVNYAFDLLYGATGWGFLQWHYLTAPVIWLISCLLTLLPCKFSDHWLPELNGKIDLHPEVPRRHPVGTAVYLASAAAFAALLTCLYLNGAWMPSRLYADRYAVKGVDVSSYQGSIDWETLAAQDISFAYVKATEGSAHTDRQFEANWDGARNSGLAVGAYHFFSFDSPGETQAQHFIDVVPAEDNALPPVVDVEFYGDKAFHNPDKADVHRELHALLDALEAHYGKKPIIYCPQNINALYEIWDEFGDYRYWTRNVLTEPDAEHWDMWQYTDRMTLDGYDGEERFIDMNVVASEEVWQSLLA